MKDDIEILRGLSRCEDKEQMARYLERIEESKTADNGGTLAKDTNVLTNADRIRAMSDEELAEVLKVFVRYDTCINPGRDCEECPFRAICDDCLPGHELEWLRQPAEVET